MRVAAIGLLALLTLYMSAAGAVHAALRWRKYGQSACELLANPGIVGGWLRTLIWARVPVAPGGVVETQLTCYHCYVAGSGKQRTTHRRVLWQEKRAVAHDQLAVEPNGQVRIPVAFHVPHDCKPTMPGEPTDRMEWAVSAIANVPGIDVKVEFIVPLFVTEESSDQAPDAPPAPPREPAGGRVS